MMITLKTSYGSASAMSPNSGRNYTVSGVCCPTEEAVLRTSLDPGLVAGRYDYNPVSHKLRVELETPGPSIIASLRAAGFVGQQSGEEESREPFLRRRAEGIAAGGATLWTAILADDGAALVVIFNALRILSCAGTR